MLAKAEWSEELGLTLRHTTAECPPKVMSEKTTWWDGALTPVTSNEPLAYPVLLEAT